MYLVDIYVVSLQNEFSCVHSDVFHPRQHTGIAYMLMVFLLNVFSCDFSDFLLHAQQMGIAEINHINVNNAHMLPVLPRL